MIRHILIGGTPSSGSSLLSVLLDNHSQICCGPELSLFSHPFFWSKIPKQDWFRVLRQKIEDNDKLDDEHNIYNGFINHNCTVDLLDLKWYGTNKDDLISLLETTENGADFFIKWAQIQAHRHNKIVYCEKSPPNIFTCNYFVNSVPESICILCIRNPLDTISSLRKRGLKLYTAASIWLCEAYIISLSKDKDSIYINRYEDLVNDPIKMLNKLFSEMKIPEEGSNIQELSMSGALSPDRAINSRESIKTWNHTPFKKIENKSILSSLSNFKSSEILFLKCLKLNKKVVTISNNKNYSFSDVASLYGYSEKEYGFDAEVSNLNEAFTLISMVIRTKLSYIKKKPRDIHKSSVHASVRSAIYLIAYSVLKKLSQ